MNISICNIKRILYRAFTIVNYSDEKAEAERTSKKFDWKSAIIDASIIAGWHFFGTLMAIRITQIIADPVKSLLAASIAAGFSFFSTLASKRGLRTEK